MAVIVKPRVIKDYEKLDNAIQEQIKMEHPFGFEESLITFTNREGKRVSALPFETDDKCYLIRMTTAEAIRFIGEDDDYNSQGQLQLNIKATYEGQEGTTEEDEDLDDEYDPEQTEI